MLVDDGDEDDGDIKIIDCVK